MSRLQSLPADARLFDVFKKFPRVFEPLVEYHQRLLREESPFTVAERELIAAFVSRVNACNYCAGVHEVTAAHFGVDAGLLAKLIDDIGTAPVADKLKPVFRYVRKLTETPSRMTDDDAAAFFAAGWDDRALHDAVAICALFNCMNRLVEGFGISADSDYYALSGGRLASSGGYGTLNNVLRELQQTPPA